MIEFTFKMKEVDFVMGMALGSVVGFLFCLGLIFLISIRRSY